MLPMTFKPLAALVVAPSYHRPVHFGTRSISTTSSAFSPRILTVRLTNSSLIISHNSLPRVFRASWAFWVRHVSQLRQTITTAMNSWSQISHWSGTLLVPRWLPVICPSRPWCCLKSKSFRKEWGLSPIQTGAIRVVVLPWHSNLYRWSGGVGVFRGCCGFECGCLVVVIDCLIECGNHSTWQPPRGGFIYHAFELVYLLTTSSIEIQDCY